MPIALRLAAAAFGVYCCAAWAGPGLPAHAQRQSDGAGPQSTFRARTDLVRVAVAVVDKKGRPLRGLTAANFTVLENGKPRKIVAFENTEPEETEATGRLVVVMFDAGIPRGDQANARRIAQRVVDTLEPADLMMVVHAAGTDTGATAFTADHRRLLAAIKAPLTPSKVAPQAGNCACGSCVADAIIRVAESLRSRSDRPKVLHVIGTYLDAGNPNEQPCGAETSAARDRVVQATQAANVRVDSVDPHDFPRRRLKMVFVERQYLLGFEPADSRQAPARDLRIKVNHPDVGDYNWVIRVR